MSTSDFAGLPWHQQSTSLPWGTCSIHGWWDTTRYASCPSCSTAAPVQFQISPQLDPPEQTCPIHGWYKAWQCPSCAALPNASQPPPMRFGEKRPWRCPVCEGRGSVPAGFYTNGISTSTSNEKCRSCEDGVIWR